MRFFSILTLFISTITFSQTVTNGSVTGAPVGNSQLANATGWSVCGFSPDLCDVGYPSYTGGSQVAPAASPDGGSWLGMAAVGSGIGECAQTSITGLTVGQQYTLCWYGANFGTGALFNGSPSNPTISVGTTSTTISIPQVAGVWTQFTLTFTATAATMTLQCNLPGGNDSYCGLDGFTISVPGGSASWTDPSPLCSSQAPINLDALVTGTAGGTWSGTGVSGNTFDPSVGTQAVTYTVNPGTCDEVFQTITINVTTGADASWTAPTGLCTGDAPVDLNSYVTGTAGGTWSGTGMSGNMFDPSVGTQSITYDVGTVPCNASLTLTISVSPGGDPGWTPPTNVCDNDPLIDLDALVTGTSGGTWSGTGVSGNMFDPASGTQSITYTVGVAPCQGVSTQTITVGTFGDPSWTPPTGLCTGSSPVDLSTLITGTSGGTWSGTGVSGNMFDPSVGTQTVTYSVGVAPCGGSSAQTINVTPGSDATWVPPTGVCDSDPLIDLSTLVTGTAGGTWSGTGVTGTNFDPASGTQSVTYMVGAAPCDDIETWTINVGITGDAAWTPPSNLCETDGPVDLSALVTGMPGGTWSGTGVTGTTFDPSVGTQNITYTSGTGSCQDVSTQAINVSTMPDPTWTTLTLCANGVPVNLDGQITGTTGGTWSGTGISGSVFDPFNGTQDITYTVTNGSCTATSTQPVTVISPVVSVTGNPVSCFGLTDGSATASVSGGSGNYSYSWNTVPPQSTANATGLPAGSYTVTVTDNTAGCDVMQTYTVVEPPEIVLTMSAVDACAPNLGSASVTANGGVGGFTYSWSPVTSSAASVSGLDSAMAYVTVTDANGCSVDDSVFVNVWPNPAVSINPDTLIYYGDQAQLWATGGISYEWTPSFDLDCSDCSSPLAEPLTTTMYCVNVTDQYGCVSDTCTMVTVEIVCGDVFVPSAFSPNDDDENDNLCVYSDCLDNMTFTIYNRWGEKVFESSNKNICWDGTWNGKVLNSAVFVYILRGSLINGQTVDQKGNISLIR